MIKKLENGKQIHLGGWRKQLNDPRDADFSLKLHRGFLATNPSSADIRTFCSPVEDQGNLGSCTANMFAGMVEANEGRGLAKLAEAAAASVAVSGVTTLSNGTITYTTTVVPPKATPTPAPAPTPAPKLVHASRLFEYYATRKIEGSTGYDSGATIRDTIKAGYTYGVVDEAMWAYDVSKFTVNPPTNVWTAAATHKVTSYHSIADGAIETMKAAIVSGYLVGFGFVVYDAMMTNAMALSGLLCRPARSESVQGGHAVALVGYDDNKVMPDGSKGAFLVRNSWGTGWGLQGYFWMASNYVSDPTLSSDFWVVQSAPL